MLANNFSESMKARLPQSLRETPWVGGLVEALAVQVQELDDATGVMNQLLRGLAITPIEHDCLGYDNGNVKFPVGVDTAITYVAGRLGLCASFNGTSSKIVTPVVAKPLTWSVNCWMYTTTNLGSGIAWFMGGTGGHQARLSHSAGTNMWWLWNGVGVSVSLEIPMSTWTMATITYDGVNAIAYKNGSIATGPVAHTITASTGAIQLGSNGTSEFYTGMLDEVGVWDRSLTASEVQDLYNSGSGTDDMSVASTGLLHQWKLNGDSQDYTGDISVTGTWSEATAQVTSIIGGDSTTGTMRLHSISGAFAVGEPLSLSGGNTARCLSLLFPWDNAWMTRLGGVVGFERDHEPDRTALRYIQGQIASNTSWGELEKIRDVAGALFGRDNVYIDDGGEYKSQTSAWGAGTAGLMSITVESSTVMSVKTSEYDRTVQQLTQCKPAGVALFVTAHHTATGLDDVFVFGLPALTAHETGGLVVVGETLTQAVSGATGVVWSYSGPVGGRTIELEYSTGTWVTGQTYSGSVSGANRGSVDALTHTGSYFGDGTSLYAVEEI